MFDMLCPGTVSGLCASLVLLVFRGISKHRVKPLRLRAISLNVSILNCTFTGVTVEFENVTLMEMTHSLRQDRHKIVRF